MSAPVIAFFSQQGGSGMTTLTYHLAWMYADLGLRVLAVDVDPQADLSASFIAADRLEQFIPAALKENHDTFGDVSRPLTIAGAIEPVLRLAPCPAESHVEEVAENLGLIVGDPKLALFEERFAKEWDQIEQPETDLRVVTSLWRVIQSAARAHDANMVLLDLAPNLGAINRAALLAADYIIVPVSPEPRSLRALGGLGDTLLRWRDQWQSLRGKLPRSQDLPGGQMEPLGYVVLSPPARLDRPAMPYQRWLDSIDLDYRAAGLFVAVDFKPRYFTAELHHYHGLMEMAQEARKPVFRLKPADGAVGAYSRATQDAYRDFHALAALVAERTGIPLPRMLEV
jgi:cellulose biosynthesis protein BcsQ